MKTKIISILALLLTVTQGAWAQTTADIGRVIAADGKMYKTVTLANKVSTASGVVAYVGTPNIAMSLTSPTYDNKLYIQFCDNDVSSGLTYCSTLSEAIATTTDGATATTKYVQLFDASNGRWYAARAARNYGAARPDGASAWSLPSAAEWNNMLKALAGTSTNLTESSQGAFSKTTVNTKLQEGGTEIDIIHETPYWTATEKDISHVWFIFLNPSGGYMASQVKRPNDPTYVRPIFTFASATNAYVVEYDANNGSGAPSAQSKTHGTALALSSTVPTRDGYTFAGWATSAEGAVAYSAGGSYTTDNDIVLYAQWTANTYSVHFNGNGNTSGSMDNESFTYDEAKTLTPNTFSRTGYTFDGWATTADGDVAYTDGQSVSNLTAENGATVELFAHWSSNTTTSGIDWNPSTNSGTFLMPAYDVEVSTELWYILKQNGETPAANKSKTDVFLERTLSNSMWSTFCAPFNAAIPTGWTVMEFTGSGYNASTQTLTLDFSDATSIVAGTPYLVKADVDGPTFEGVSQDWTAYNEVTPATNGGYATFVPVLTPMTLNANDKTKLYLGGNNTLYYPSGDVNVKGFRAYFQLNNGLTAGEPSSSGAARAFVLNIDGEQTGIRSLTPDASPKGEGSIYSLDGRKVQNTTRKGVYIVNGKKVVIK